MNRTKSKTTTITKEILENYIEDGKSIVEMAKILKVSKNKIGRLIKKFDIKFREKYKKINEKVNNLTKENLEALYKSGISINEIARQLNTYSDKIRRLNLKFGINISDFQEYRHKYNVHIFDSIDTEEKAYWLGFLYADGNVRKDKLNPTVSINLSAVDFNHVKKFKLFMEDTRDISVISHRTRITASGRQQEMVQYSVSFEHIRQSLIKLGCVPNKSLILTFPDLSIFNEKELVYDFICGYIDGDGCLSMVGRKTKRLSISVRGTKDFLLGIKNIFPEFSLYSEVDKRTGNTQYKIYCGSDKADKVAMKLYNNAVVYLDRKYEKFTALCKLYSEKLGNIGEGCDVNTETTNEISKGSLAS